MEEISIRELQHYVYCPHRWGLIHIACDWSENYFVSKANIIHSAVDDGKSRLFRGKYVEHTVQIYDEARAIHGVLDCLEFEPNENGCYVEKYGGKFLPIIVEYKPSVTKAELASAADRIQMLAQKICVDSMFGVDCPVCIYYADVRKRYPVTFTKEDYALLDNSLAEIRSMYASGTVPPVRNTQYCGGCSMADICLPKVGKAYAKTS